MMNLEWHDFYAIGVKFIDNDHRRILKILRDIEEATNKGDYVASRNLCKLWLKEVKAHFEREESYLEETKFLGVMEHKEFHQKLLDEIDRNSNMFEGIENHDSWKKSMEKMVRLLIDDIFRGDIKFKSHLEYEGYIEPEIKKIT